jgi:hypothetical protein
VINSHPLYQLSYRGIFFNVLVLKKQPGPNGPGCNSPGRARTADLVINSHPLYQLSYRGMDSTLSSILQIGPGIVNHLLKILENSIDDFHGVHLPCVGKSKGPGLVFEGHIPYLD